MSSKQNIIEEIKQHVPVLLKETALSSAVMVLLLLTEQDTFEIILTKRAQTLSSYAGDYSFPGGIREPVDSNLLFTAERELLEELNITPENYQHIGQLDDFHDRKGQLVRPFVSYMLKATFMENYIISTDEITELYFFPIDTLNKIEESPHLRYITRRHPSYTFSNGDFFVWGLTATILVHLNNIVTKTNKPLGKTVSNQMVDK